MVVLRQLQRILASAAFAASERMSRFLRFVTEETLAGRSTDLKEYSIGLAVFDKQSSYDTRTDPIVRVEVRRLRAKLEQYYESEGRGDELLIELPKGRYAPVFRKRSSGTAEEGEGAQEDTVAVLPFANLSPDPENEYFSDGLTQELIRALTKLEGLRVVAWTTASQFRGRSTDVYEIGKKLKAGSVLEGSVRRSGDRLRITVQLIHTKTGYYLWSETYDRQMRDLFAIQDEISGAIASVLRLRLAGRPAAGAAPGTPRNLEAYNLYLKGRFFWNKRTKAGLEKGVEYFERAIAEDPDCALAYAGMADAYSLLGQYGLSWPADVMPKAREAAMKALAIDSTLAEPHTSLGFISSHYEWRWKEAEDRYLRAIALNPGYATAHYWYAIDCLAMLGRLEEALAEIRLAARLDPLSATIQVDEGYIHLLGGDYSAALRQFQKAIELDGQFFRAYTAFGRVYDCLGRRQVAIAMFHKAIACFGDTAHILGYLGHAHAAAGNAEEARRLLDELSAMSARGYTPATSFALIHIGLGEKDRALDWLELGAERRELTLAGLKVRPPYQELRSEPRFAALLHRIGLGD